MFTFHGNDAQLEPQRLLGAVVTTLHAQPLLSSQNIAGAVKTFAFLAGSGLENQVERVRFTPTALSLEELLPSSDAGPEAEFARLVLMEALDDALDELPPEQREVFVAHEVMGRSFKEMAEESGVSMNTLLARKRYAVLHLRERLQGIYDEFVG